VNYLHIKRIGSPSHYESPLMIYKHTIMRVCNHQETKGLETFPAC